MPDEFFNRVLLGITAEATADMRAVVPGKVAEVTRATNGERIISFAPGIGRRQAGDQVSDGIVPGRPVLYPNGGGWSVAWPLDAGDECTGLAVDRNPERWESNRIPGQAHSLADARPHDVSNVHLLPVAMTASSGPADPGTDYVISNDRGEVLRLGLGELTISTPGPDPLNVATIELAPGGDISLTVATGKFVVLGDGAAVALTRWAALDAAITALLIAGSGAGTGAPGTTGKLAFDAAKIAYDTATGVSSPATTKVKGV